MKKTGPAEAVPSSTGGGAQQPDGAGDGASTTIEQARLEERAATLQECADTARLFEDRGADAGIVRLVLQQRAREAWKHIAPLDEDPTLGRATGSSSSGARADGALPPSGEAPLDSQRLTYIAASLSRAADVLDEPASRRVFGGVAKSMGDYLRALRDFALGHDVDDSVIQPQSLKADPTKLRVVE